MKYEIHSCWDDREHGWPLELEFGHETEDYDDAIRWIQGDMVEMAFMKIPDKKVYVIYEDGKPLEGCTYLPEMTFTYKTVPFDVAKGDL